MKNLCMRVVASLAIVLSLAGCGDQREQVQLNGSTMGTYYAIKYIQTDGLDLPDPQTVQAEIDKRLELVNDQMSTYRPESELSRFNQHKSTEPFPVSAATAKVIRVALTFSEMSQGAYDVTVGALVNLWSFGPEARPDEKPTDEEITQRLTEVGYKNLSVTDDNKLIKQNPDLYVDLSSIAKGYGVDVVAEYLHSLGVTNYMVDIGGELRVKGQNLENIGWRIAVEKPLSNERAVQEIIQVGDNGIATSGDYRNYFEENGVRYSHLIDPRTGKPIENHVVSVTVISSESMMADGYSTMFSVLGEEASIALANQKQVPVLIIVKTSEGFKEYASDAFAQYVTTNKK